MPRSVRSCTTLTTWRRLRPSRSSFQTTSVSPARSALRHASSPGRSIGQGADDHRRGQGMAGVAGLGLSTRIVDDATVSSPCACTSRAQNLRHLGFEFGIAAFQVGVAMCGSA
jgi:hypothetical protein